MDRKSETAGIFLAGQNVQQLKTATEGDNVNLHDRPTTEATSGPAGASSWPHSGLQEPSSREFGQFQNEKYKVFHGIFGSRVF